MVFVGTVLRKHPAGYWVITDIKQKKIQALNFNLYFQVLYDDCKDKKNNNK